MATSKFWIKVYTETLHDPKIMRLPEFMRWRFIALLLLAGENDQAGLLPPVSDIAWHLHLDEPQVEETLSALSLVGVVATQPDGWLVVNFEKRQAPSESAQRVQKWREKQRYSNSYSNVTRNTPESESESEKSREESESESESKRYDDSLSLAFEAETGILRGGNGGSEKWTEAEIAMLKAGVEPQDVRQAVRELQAKKKYAIVGLQSVSMAAMMARARRQSSSSRVLIGPNGEATTV